MASVIGVGGVFLRVADPAATREWYERVLGFYGELGYAANTSQPLEKWLDPTKRGDR